MKQFADEVSAQCSIPTYFNHRNR